MPGGRCDLDVEMAIPITMLLTHTIARTPEFAQQSQHANSPYDRFSTEASKQLHIQWLFRIVQSSEFRSLELAEASVLS